METFRSGDLMTIVGRYMTTEDCSKVYRAFLRAADAHDGVFRKGGQPYITHPLEVARILADLHMDAEGICAAVLHDVIEDTPYTKDDITIEFGEVVADLVDGVTKFEYDGFDSKQDALIASFRKMMGHMTKDYRVVLIKLADRIHNLRTIGATKRASQVRKAKETFELYIPLARRMGMNKIRRELEILAFQAQYPWRAATLQNTIKSYQLRHQEKHNAVIDTLTAALQKQGLESAALFRWEKNICRLYRRLKQHKQSGQRLSDKDDLLDIRILVQTTAECYQALGIIHQAYLPKAGKFNDFIAAPKVYGFQALQTTLQTPGQQLITVQIQTQAMFQISQYGIAAKWRYPDLLRNAGITEQRLNSWLSQVGEIHENNYDPMDFYQDMQADLFLSEIQVYTVDNQLISLPHGSTAIDFAYTLGSKIGHTCEGVLIDGVPASLKKPLPNGAGIEIITAKDGKPTLKPSWQKIVKTAKARAAIRRWFKQRKDSEFIALGQTLFNNALAKYGLSINDLSEEKLNHALAITHLTSLDELWRAFGDGSQCVKLTTKRLLDVRTHQVEHLAPIANTKNISDHQDNVLIQGAEGLAIHLQTCCYPLPGDLITAKFSPAYGLEVHRSDCQTMLQNSSVDMEDELAVSWADNVQQSFLAPLNIRVKNEVGILSTIALVFADMQINIESLTVLPQEQDDKVLQFLIRVKSTKHLQKAITQILRHNKILEAERPYHLNS
ncbi:MAG: RelA/SpoT family protein [bacterium]